MCNLHANTLSHEAMRRLFDVDPDRSHLGNFAPLSSIYPKNDAPTVLIDDDGERSLQVSSWGFLTPKKSKKTGGWTITPSPSSVNKEAAIASASSTFGARRR